MAATLQENSRPASSTRARTDSRRVAVFIPDFTGGGAERAMLKLADGLRERGHTVDFLVANAVGPYKEQVPAGLRVIDLKASQPRSALKPLMAYLRAERPVALLSALHNANVAALLATRMARVPTRNVLSIQNNYTAEAVKATTRREKFIRLCVRLFYPLADHVVAVSQGVAEDMKRSLPLKPERVQVIYNPIITDELLHKATLPPTHPWLTNDSNAQNGYPPVILAVGRLHLQKDYPTLLRAFALVRQRMPARLLVLGEGEERARLEALTKELNLADDVQLPGFVENPFACMNRAAVYAMSSRWEGLPTVLIEALACGTPVVSTDCPSGPNEILEGGKWGHLVPMSDPQALADALVTILAKEKVRPSEECWARFRSRDSIAQFARLLTLE